MHAHARRYGVFLEVPPTAYILEHDLQPTTGYVFLNRLMQRHAAGIMLQTERDNILGRMEELKASIGEYRKKEAEERHKAEALKAGLKSAQPSVEGVGKEPSTPSATATASSRSIGARLTSSRSTVARIRNRFRRKPTAPKEAGKLAGLDAVSVSVVPAGGQ